MGDVSKEMKGPGHLCVTRKGKRPDRGSIAYHPMALHLPDARLLLSRCSEPGLTRDLEVRTWRSRTRKTLKRCVAPLARAFERGHLPADGTEILKILPPISRFVKPCEGESRAEKKARVIAKLKVYLERFLGA